MGIFEFYEAYTNEYFPLIILFVAYLSKWALLDKKIVKPGSWSANIIIFPDYVQRTAGSRCELDSD